jgi:four helix bundle protein
MAFKFENLLVWQKAMEIIEQVNVVAKKFPNDEMYVLTSQLKRAADSTALNIAEGSQGQSKAEFRRFLGIALRSGIEVVGCLFIAQTRNIISTEDFNLLYAKEEELAKMIQSLRKTLEN